MNPLGGSALDKAVGYAKNHRELLGNYLLNGRCEISNNRAERCAKSYGTGRKNFLFHDSVKGAESSLPYSKVQTFSVETSGVLDMDSELGLWFSSVGLVKFEFTGNSDIVRIGQAIGTFIL